MKTINFENYLLALLASVAIVSCVQDDDFSVPESVGAEENRALNELLSGGVNLVSISELKAMYDSDPNGDGNNNDAIPFRVETDIVVKGYVTSSDLSGNFYKEVYLQDSPENPTSAIKVILSQVDSYNRFNKGREVYIRLNPTFENGAPGGLYIGEERTGNEVITIGGGTESDQYGTTVTSLSQNQMNATMLRSEITEEIVPLNVQFSQISSDHIGMFVQIDNVEFEDNLDGLRYFDPSEDYDTQRTLQSCSGFSYSNMNIETSSFANFKNEMLPTGNGSIGGLVVKTYDGSSLVLALNTTDDVDFNGERCELLSTFFEEKFDTAIDGTNLDISDWINYAEAGNELWTEQVYSGNGYAEFSAYNTGNSSNIGWLISPGIDMDAQEGEVLNFQTEYAYPDEGHYPLEVFVSTDFSGEESGIASATWEPLSVVIAHPDITEDWFDWIDSGLIDLSSYTGTLYIAFKYTGSDISNQNSMIHIDNFVLSSE